MTASTPRYWQPLVISLALVVLTLGVSACGKHKDAATPSITDPIVAATVNGKPIYISDLESEAVVRGLLKEGEELDPASDEFYQILEDLIETRLFAMEAEARQLDRNADVRHRLDRARELILAGALNEQLKETAVDEASIERMYKDQIKVLRSSREVRIRRIVAASKDAASAAKRRIDSGEAFEALAYEMSTDRGSASEGGDMGFVLPEQLQEALRGPAATAAVGETVGPIQTDLGWTLLRIEERREEAPPSMAILRPQIERWLMFEEQRRLVERLKSQARIERLVEQNKGFTPSEETPENLSAGSEARRRKEEVPLGPGAVAGAAEPTGALAEPLAASPAPSLPPAQKTAPAATAPRRTAPPATTAPAPRPKVDAVLPPVRDSAPASPPPALPPTPTESANPET